MLKNFFLKYGDFLFIAGSALATRFWNLAYPARVVFDEAHFGLYASKYLSGTYFWDIHPPLGKLLFALVGEFSGLKPGFDFKELAAYSDSSFVFLRGFSALFGVLVILLVYGMTRRVTHSRGIAFLASLLLIFDNAFLIQSRFILLDSILVFFMLATLFCFFLFREERVFSRRWYFFLVATGTFGGLAMSVKWTGLAALGTVWFLVLVLRYYRVLKQRGLYIAFVMLGIIPLLLYLSTFFVHFSLLHMSCTSDCGYVLELYNVEDISMPEGNIITKIAREHTRLFIANFLVPWEDKKYVAASPWFTWPFMGKPIPYFTAEGNGEVVSIYLLGNPVVWDLGLVGLAGYLLILFRRASHTLGISPSQFSFLHTLVISYGFYLASFFVFVRRPTLLYHYFFPLILSLIVFACIFDYTARRIVERRHALFLYGSLVVFLLLGFIFFMPLSYGLPLTEGEFRLRMWLPFWDYSQ